MKKILVISNYVPKAGFDYSGGLQACKHREVSHDRLLTLEEKFSENFKKDEVEWDFLYIERFNVVKLWEKLCEDFDLLIISGSPFCCNESPFWMDNLRICIRDFCEKFPEKKILSICFGTQIMAEILGGTIDYCDNDEFYNGESEIKFTDFFHDFLEEKAPDQDLMSSIHMRIYHENYISSVPEGAMVYGIGKYQMPYLIKFSQNNWGFQPHIECNLACAKQQKDLDIFLKKFFRKFLED